MRPSTMNAAGDQHAWASVIGSGTLPTYNPFDPPTRPDGTPAAALLRHLGRDPEWTA